MNRNRVTRNASNVEKMADTTACLAKASRTIVELCDVTGNADTAVRAHVKALIAEGLVVGSRLPQREEGRGRPAILYRWAL